MSKLKFKLKRMLSFFTTFVLAMSTITTAVTPLSVYAASTVKDVNISRLDKAVTKGYGHFNLESDSSGYEIEHSKNLTKAKKTGDKDWIWEDRDQGSSSSIDNLGNAYISSLESGENYWIQYNGIQMLDNDNRPKGTYDVRAVFNNPKGTISGADGKDIAVFDGQLGAVRFRGYKSLDCSIYIYEHGTKNLVSGDRI